MTMMMVRVIMMMALGIHEDNGDDADDDDVDDDVVEDDIE